MNIHSFSRADLILCQFGRPMVEAGDINCFLEQFALERLPKGPALRHYCNRFSFFVTGYEDDIRELYEIPEVRSFFQAFRKAWPYWFFACHLEFPDLQMMTFCCLSSLVVRRRDHTPGVQVLLQGAELSDFLLDDFEGMNLLFEQAGMSEAENMRRSREIYEYYQRDWSGFDQTRAEFVA